MNCGCSQPGPDVRPLTLRQGDRLVYAGLIRPGQGSSVTSPAVEAQVRTRPEDSLVHDFGVVTVTGPNEAGEYGYKLDEAGTAGWPLGQLNLGVRIYTAETGWQTVTMRPITCKPAGVVEGVP